MKTNHTSNINWYNRFVKSVEYMDIVSHWKNALFISRCVHVGIN